MKGTLPIETWHADLDALADPLEALQQRDGLLAAEEVAEFQSAASALAPAVDRMRRRRLCRIALRFLLMRAGAPDVRKVAFDLSPTGKPSLRKAPAFSVSYSGRHALIAVGGSRALGVDLETPRTISIGERRRSLLIAAGQGLAHMSPTASSPPKDDSHPFLVAWTRLEAFAKASGDGIGETLTTLGITARATPSLQEADVQDRAVTLSRSTGIHTLDLDVPAPGIAAIAAAQEQLQCLPPCRVLEPRDLVI